MAYEGTRGDLNLTTHRAPASVWDRRGWNGSREQLTLTRWLVGVGGGALVVQGLRRRSVGGSLLAGVGTTLTWWALSGEGNFVETRGRIAEFFERFGSRAIDRVVDASADSFPASDAPSWTPTVGTGVRRHGRQPASSSRVGADRVH